MKVVIYLLPASLLDMFSPSFDRIQCIVATLTSFFLIGSVCVSFYHFVLSNPDKVIKRMK
jgi:hypothetical protein